jgi:hypothetical protein
MADNEWHHVAATYDGEVRKLFIDFELVAQDSPDETLIQKKFLPRGRFHPRENHDRVRGQQRAWSTRLTLLGQVERAPCVEYSIRHQFLEESHRRYM